MALGALKQKLRLPGIGRRGDFQVRDGHGCTEHEADRYQQVLTLEEAERKVDQRIDPSALLALPDL